MPNAYYYYLLRRGMLRGGLPTWAKNYRDRMNTEGATLEGLKCVTRAVGALPQADKGRVAFDAYNTRTTSDGGSIEARTCTINAINELS
jgi:hypothetical protein